MTTRAFAQSNVIYGTGVPATLAPAGTRYIDTTASGVQIEYVSTGTAWVPLGINSPTTFANLPAAATATKGLRACVTDGNATLTAGIGAAAGGGGANICPVFCDGTTWRYG